MKTLRSPSSFHATALRNKARYNRQTRYMAPPHSEPLPKALPSLIRVMWDECATGVWGPHTVLELESLSPFMSPSWFARLEQWYVAMGKAMNSTLASLAEVIELDHQGLVLAQELAAGLQGQQSRGKPVKVAYWRESTSICPGPSNPLVTVTVARSGTSASSSASADRFVQENLSEARAWSARFPNKPHCFLLGSLSQLS